MVTQMDLYCYQLRAFLVCNMLVTVCVGEHGSLIPSENYTQSNYLLCLSVG